MEITSVPTHTVSICLLVHEYVRTLRSAKLTPLCNERFLIHARLNALANISFSFCKFPNMYFHTILPFYFIKIYRNGGTECHAEWRANRVLSHAEWHTNVILMIDRRCAEFYRSILRKSKLKIMVPMS